MSHRDAVCGPRRRISRTIEETRGGATGEKKTQTV